MAWNLSMLAGVGAGASALGEGLTNLSRQQMRDRELAEEQRRRAEADALAKAAGRSNELKTLEGMNYTPDPMMSDGKDAVNKSLSDLALNGQSDPRDVFTSTIDNQRYSRPQSQRPSVLKDELQDSKNETALAKQMLVNSGRLENTGRVQQGMDGRYDRQGANNAASNDTAALIAAMNMQGRQQIAAMQQEGANTRAAVDGGKTRIPQVLQNEMRSQLDILDALGAADVSSQSPAAKGAFGLKNSVAEWVLPSSMEAWGKDKLNPEGAVPRQDVARVTSAIQLLRSGKAVTTAELKVLLPYLPREGESLEMIQQKLPGIKREFARMLERRLNMYEGDPLAQQYREELWALTQGAKTTGGSALDKLKGMSGRP